MGRVLKPLSGPIDAPEFGAAMAGFAPFEPEPLIAVAVSGGPDSLALTLLLDRWARECGGRVIGLTVDHGLRPESAEEARRVAGWLGVRGIAHDILAWAGEKPTAGLQEAARRARYGLLAEACAARGAPHLAVAHHADDQAETVLFRRERGSGPDGLAGMPAARSLGNCRLIRPLLPWPPAARGATGAAFGPAFVTDPSNRADRYARTGLRGRLAGDGGETRALLDLAASSAAARDARGEAVNGRLGALAEVRPDGIVILDRAGLARCDPPMRQAVLAAALRVAGGGEHAPPAVAVHRLDIDVHACARPFRGAALAGCAVRPWRADLLICREPGRAAPPMVLLPSLWGFWDRRFRVCIGALGCGAGPFTVGALGAAGFARLRRLSPTPLPAVAGAGLPAIRSGEKLMAVPALGWRENDGPEVEQRFTPPCSLSSERFTVVNAGQNIMFGKGYGGRQP